MLRCPICKQTANRKGNPFHPFCSERCKMIDLDNWLEGRYRVPVASTIEDEGDDVAQLSPDSKDDSE
jgi:endogenous inhibitor of DNA gyrase (YacG/DUF329 family)